MNETITQALDAYIPRIALQYQTTVEKLFARAVEKYGPALKGAGGCYDPMTRQVQTLLWPVIRRENYNPANPAILDLAAVAAAADEYAKKTVTVWKQKIEAKLGGLDDAVVECLSDHTFLIRGTRGGRRVVIEQRMIVNVSARGALYNQFPARIYLDGVFTSEATYKRTFA